MSARPVCPDCGRQLVPVKQIVFEALDRGASVREAARAATCSRWYVQQLKRARDAGQMQLPLAAVSR
jgi:hypothetical protein